MSNSYETTINNFPYFKKETSIIEATEILNNYSVSGSLPDSISSLQKQPWELLYNCINNDPTTRTLPKPPDTILNDDVVKQLYLDIYSEILQSFIISGNQSVFLRELAVTGSNNSEASLTGIDILNQSKFYQIIDIQQLKESVSESLLDPCLLMDSNPKSTTIQPLKLQLIKANFRLLCRVIALSTKLQNLFLSSIFNNEEFYKSGNLYDSIYLDYSFEILNQKMSSLISGYKTSIEVFLYEELKEKISNGEEILDPINQQPIEFSTPLTDLNLSENIKKYLQVLFKTEFMFVAKKANEFFNLSGTDPESQQKFYLAPTSTFGVNKLLTAKEYFLESLTITGVSSEINDGSGTTDFDITVLKSRNKKIFLELSFDRQNEESNDVIANLKVKCLAFGGTTYERTIELCSTSTNGRLRTSASSANITTFLLNNLTQLKQLMLINEDFSVVSNFMFPSNKILNISSLFYINLMNKLYENLNIIFDGSIKTIANIHDTILGNEESLSCSSEQGSEIDLDNMKFGVNLELLKLIAVSPLDIIKGMEETFDPNISIASKIRTFAESLGAPKLPIIPYSLGLAPALTFPPPYGIGPPLIAPWGYIYWGIDAAEIIVDYAKNGFNTNDVKISSNFDLSISKDPFKPDC